MPKTLEFDTTGGLARVSAGMTLDEFYRRLWRHGMSLQTVGGIAAQTVGGAVATGTHGSAVGPASMSGAVARMELVGADGDHIDISSTSTDLPAAAMSLGALGVTTHVHFRCQVAEPLAAITDSTSLAEALQRRPAAGDHYEFDWFPFTSAARTFEVVTTSRSRELGAELRRSAQHILLTDLLFGGLERIGAMRPHLLPRFLRFAANATAGRGVRVARWYQALTGSPTAWRADDIEYALPSGLLESAFRELRTVINRFAATEEHFATVPVNVRFGGAEPNVLLSPCNPTSAPGLNDETDFAYVDVPAYSESPGREEFLRAVAAVLTAHQGVPHPGKSFFGYCVPDHILSEFNEVRGRLDPNRKFVNEFLRSFLKLEPKVL